MADSPGPQFTFPQYMTAIKFAAGDWIVVSVHFEREAWNGSFKLSVPPDFEQDGYDAVPGLAKFPFVEDKPVSFTPQEIKDEPTKKWAGWRNVDNPNDPPPEDDSGDQTPHSSNEDVFTALYFQPNKRAKDDKTKEEDRTADPIILEFPKLIVPGTGPGINYYVWPDDNGDPTRPYFPEPTKDQALGPPPASQWPYLGGEAEAKTHVWISYYNSEGSWYETWSPGLRHQMGEVIGYATFDALQKPNGNFWGWANKSDRDAFLAAWNSFAAHSQAGDGAYHDYWPLPNYHALEFDWSTPPDPNGKKARISVKIDAYRLRMNNIKFDEKNELKVKLPAEGKSHAVKSFTMTAPADARRLRIDWDGKNGVRISDI